MDSKTRIVLAFVLGYCISLIVSILNGRAFFLALQSSLAFAVIVTVIVALLSWGMEIAAHKGYSEWLGFWLVLILNVFGLLLLVILPQKI